MPVAKIAFVLDDMFEDSEFRVPYDEAKSAGHDVTVISTEEGRTLQGKQGKEKITADTGIGGVQAGDFDALVIPGGYSPDKLRMNGDIVAFTKAMASAGKPIAAVCHAGSLLIEAGLVDKKRVTSWPSIRTDLINAGAEWVDEEVVEDGTLITSRKPDDLPAFSKALLAQVEQTT